MADPYFEDPLYGHPWQPPMRRQALRKQRHARWLKALTDHDWSRIRRLADQVRPGHWPARLDDLDAPGIAVAVTPVEAERWVSGERIGTVRNGEVAVLVWVK